MRVFARSLTLPDRFFLFAMLSYYTVVVDKPDAGAQTASVRFLRKKNVQLSENTNKNRKLKRDKRLKHVDQDEAKHDVKYYEYEPDLSFQIDLPIFKNYQGSLKDLFEIKTTVLKYVIQKSMNSDPGAILPNVYASVLSGSGIAYPISLKSFVPSDYKVRFMPPPKIHKFQLRAAMAVEATKCPDKFQSGVCFNCNREQLLNVKCGCGKLYCPCFFTSVYSRVGVREPPKCFCGSSVVISGAFGLTGVDYAYAAGHDPKPFGGLVHHYFRHNLKYSGQQLKVRSYFLSKAAEFAVQVIVGLPVKSVEPLNILDTSIYGDYMPDGSIGAIKERKTKGRITKAMVADQIRETMGEFFFKLYNNIESVGDTSKIVREYMSSLYAAAIKQEMIAPSVTSKGYVSKESARIFQMQDGVNYAIMRMFLSPFTQTGGTRSRVNVQPCAIGMDFTRAADFMCEMYDVDPVNLANVRTKEDIKFLEDSILERWYVYESDAKKFDISLKADILVVGMMALLNRYNVSYDPDEDTHITKIKRCNRVILARMVERVGIKLTTRLDGKGVHTLLGTMPSGSYETSFLNTICNFIHHLIVYAMYHMQFEDQSAQQAFETVKKNWNAGLIRLKLFGDDVLAAHCRKTYSEFSPKFYCETLLSYCGVTVPLDEFVIADKIFVTSASMKFQREKVPTFLKFQLAAFPFSDYARFAFFRHHSHVLPKMFTSSDKDTTPVTLFQKIICAAWTTGVNPLIYKACSVAVGELTKYGELKGEFCNMDGILERFNLPDDIFENGMPSYEEVFNRAVGANEGEQVVRMRTFMTWNQICKFPKQKPAHYTPEELERFEFEFSKKHPNHQRYGPMPLNV